MNNRKYVYIYIYIHTHTHTYTYIHTHTYTYTHIHTYIHMHLHIYVVKLLMLVRQKRNLEQDLIIIKVHRGPIEKNLKYHSNVFMNIMGNTVVMGLMVGISH